MVLQPMTGGFTRRNSVRYSLLAAEWTAVHWNESALSMKAYCGLRASMDGVAERNGADALHAAEADVELTMTRSRTSSVETRPIRVGSPRSKTESSYSVMVSFTVNDQQQSVDVDADTPLLWVLRDHLGLTGTKYGCGLALCGACTVHVDGVAVRSCLLPLKALEGKSVMTVEGLSKDRSHAVQRAWIELDVPQCGYCQSGQIMSAVALLRDNPAPTDDDIDAALAGNICRCGTYSRIRKAIYRAAELLRGAQSS